MAAENKELLVPYDYPNVSLFNGRPWTAELRAEGKQLIQDAMDSQAESKRLFIAKPKMVVITSETAGDNSVGPYEKGVENVVRSVGGEVLFLPYRPNASVGEVIARVRDANQMEDCAGIVVVRSGSGMDAAMWEIDPDKDVDVLNPETERLGLYPPPTATVTIRILNWLIEHQYLGEYQDEIKMAVVGLGKIGLCIAEYYQGFGLEVIGINKGDRRNLLSEVDGICAALPSDPDEETVILPENIKRTRRPVLCSVGDYGFTSEAEALASVYVHSRKSIGGQATGQLGVNFARSFQRLVSDTC